MANAQQLPSSGFKESLTLCEEGRESVTQLSQLWL